MAKQSGKGPKGGVIINGTLAPIKQSGTEISFDPSRGRTVTENYASAGDNLGGIALSCEAARIAYHLKASPVISRLTLTATGQHSGTPAYAADTWQIPSNELQNDIKQHPKALSAEETLPGIISHVVADLDSLSRGETVDYNFYLYPGGTSTIVPAAGKTSDQIETAYLYAISLLDLLKRGNSHWALSQYVLRHTANVSNAIIDLDTDDGFEHVYTTPQLLTEISSGWTFNCPPRLLSKIVNITTPAPVAHDGYLYGWLKKGSSESTAANNRVDISWEYWLAEWSCPFLYPPK